MTAKKSSQKRLKKSSAGSKRSLTKSNSKKHPVHKRVAHKVRAVFSRGFVNVKVLRLLAIFAVAGMGIYLLRFSSANTTYGGAYNTCQFNDKECVYQSKEGQLGRMYEALFNRFPDKGGLDYWKGQWTTGKTIQSVGEQIINHSSPEATNATKAATKEGFVDALYRNILDRAADSSGKTYWVGKLGSNTAVDKVNVAMAFTNVAETKTKLSDSTYNQLAAYYPNQLRIPPGCPGSNQGPGVAGTLCPDGSRVPAQTGNASNQPAPTNQTATNNNAPAPSATPASTPAPTSATPTDTTPNPKANATAQYPAVVCNNNTACIYDSREGQVIRGVYLFAANQDPDFNGFVTWMRRLTTVHQDDSGKLIEEVINLQTNDRTKSLYALIKANNTDALATELYQSLLGRPADAGGKAYWSGRIRQIGFGDAVIEISKSNYTGQEAFNRPNFRNSGKTFGRYVREKVDVMYTNPPASIPQVVVPPPVISVGTTSSSSGSSGSGGSARVLCDAACVAWATGLANNIVSAERQDRQRLSNLRPPIIHYQGNAQERGTTTQPWYICNVRRLPQQYSHAYIQVFSSNFRTTDNAGDAKKYFVPSADSRSCINRGGWNQLLNYQIEYYRARS